jgi:hypothetical protein
VEEGEKSEVTTKKAERTESFINFRLFRYFHVGAGVSLDFKKKIFHFSFEE